MATKIGIACPDCEQALGIRLGLLVNDGRIVFITACHNCNDKASVRIFYKLDQKDFIEASLRGLPIVEYGKRK